MFIILMLMHVNFMCVDCYINLAYEVCLNKLFHLLTEVLYFGVVIYEILMLQSHNYKTSSFIVI